MDEIADIAGKAFVPERDMPQDILRVPFFVDHHFRISPILENRYEVRYRLIK